MIPWVKKKIVSVQVHSSIVTRPVARELALKEYLSVCMIDGLKNVLFLFWRGRKPAHSPATNFKILDLSFFFLFFFCYFVGAARKKHWKHFTHTLYPTKQSCVLLHTYLFIAQSHSSLQPLRQSSSSFWKEREETKQLDTVGTVQKPPAGLRVHVWASARLNSACTAVGGVRQKGFRWQDAEASLQSFVV